VKDTTLPVTLAEWKLFRAVEAASRRNNLPWVRFKHETLLLAWYFKLSQFCLALSECSVSGHGAVCLAGECWLGLLCVWTSDAT